MYQPLYEMANTYLSNGYSVIYGAEILNESEEDMVIQNIKNSSTSQVARDNISHGLLSVVSSNQIFEICGVHHDNLVNFWNSSAKDALNRTNRSSILFSSPDSYYNSHQHHPFMMFEKAMGKKILTNTIMICWYTQNWIKNMSLASIIKILTSHKCTIHQGWKIKEWTESDIIMVVRQGIDIQLGADSSILFFQTMKAIHKLTENDIVTKPIIFEGMLHRLLDDRANAVIDSIFELLVKKASYFEGVNPTG